MLSVLPFFIEKVIETYIRKGISNRLRQIIFSGKKFITVLGRIMN